MHSANIYYFLQYLLPHEFFLNNKIKYIFKHITNCVFLYSIFYYLLINIYFGSKIAKNKFTRNSTVGDLERKEEKQICTFLNIILSYSQEQIKHSTGKRYPTLKMLQAILAY